MQPSYGVPDINHQQFLKNDDSCSSVFPISNPSQNLNHPFQQKQQQQQQPPEHILLPHQNLVPITHQLFQHQHFRPFQQHHHQQRLPHLPLVMPHSWHPQEDSTSIKQPFWKQLSRSNTKQQVCEDEEQEIQGNENKSYNSERCKDLENKCRFFGELEAIYSLAKVCETNNQTGSGSALTGENSPTNPALLMPFSTLHAQNSGPIGAANATIGVDHGSENSIGEEASLRKSQKRIRKTKMKEKLTSLAGFFENLVKQVMDHQEMLHKKFLEVIERMDKERTEREEAWRHKEAAKYNREAISRAHEQALASSRESQIVSYIEKITGQCIDLPVRKTPFFMQPEIPREPTKDLIKLSDNNQSRWPKAEVEVLIQVRSSIETKFQEPGLKGPLWEEVSSLMSSMGYQRSAKRCKEKWENINKYFRKAKESTKKRSQQSKTCSYFNQLDQLYSRTFINSPPSNNSCMPIINGEIAAEKQGYSELLEAFIAANPSSGNMKIGELGPSRLEFNKQESHVKEKQDHEDDYEEDQSGDSDDEEEEIGMEH